MVFSDLVFLYLFLPLNLFLYYSFKSRIYKNFVLIVSSLVFYSWGEPVWVILLIFSATIDYFHGRIIQKNRKNWKSKLALISSLCVNLGLLIVFKYSGMIVESFNSLGFYQLQVPNFALPIGISFYTFQTISYVIDVYRGEVRAQQDYFKFLLFVSLFHQLVAGPIVRYKDIAEDIKKRVFSIRQFSQGINRFALGLAKKVVIANNIGQLSQIILKQSIEGMPVFSAWIGAAFFGLQIYFDFSAYSDMAIGLGKMFGFNYQENFNYPYVARSATDFWRRWHMSLGSFFRDYVYIPMGGNRKNFLLNLITVWFLTGLWHGASWNFVLWGLFYGVLIGIEKGLGKLTNWRPPRIFGHLYLIFISIIGWTLFQFENLDQCLLFLQKMFSFETDVLWDSNIELLIFNNIFFILFVLIACTPIIPAIRKHLDNNKNRSTGFLYNLFNWLHPVVNIGFIAISTIMLTAQSYNPFLYFRF